MFEPKGPPKEPMIDEKFEQEQKESIQRMFDMDNPNDFYEQYRNKGSELLPYYEF